MRAAFDIARKDLRQRMRDRSAILMGIVAPFVLAALFAVMLGGVEQGFHADWAVVDLDGGELSTALIGGPLAGVQDAGAVTLEQLSSRDAARTAVDDRSIDTAIIIPAGFSDDVAAGRGSSVELITNPDAAISAEVARSVLDGFTNEVNAVGVAVATSAAASGQFPDAATTERLVSLARAQPAPIVIAADAAENRTASTSTYYAASMSILFVFLAAQFGVVSLLTEKREGTLARIIAAPLKPAAVLAGKMLVSMVIAVTSMAIIVIGTSVLLGAHWGDPISVAVLILAAALAATGFALLAVGFARSEDQAATAVAIMTMTLAILGGSFFPVSQAPGFMAQLSLITPHAWFLRGIDDISTGGNVVTAIGPVAVLVVIGVVAGSVGMLRARRVLVS